MFLMCSSTRARIFASLWLSLLVLTAACASPRTPTFPLSDSMPVPAATPATTVYEPPLKFDRILLEQGLSQSSINCIVQDRQGFM